MIKKLILFTSVILFNPNLSYAEEVRAYRKAKVSFSDFKELVGKVGKHRENNLVNFDTFLKMSKDPNVIILDTRSEFRFKRIHLKGAKHLNFADFTQENLKKIIPDADTKILIYCNNNFSGNELDFASKMFIPGENNPADDIASKQFTEQQKSIMLALNVPTYINLYGYGYRNIYELHELLDVADSRIEFEGSLIK